MTIVLTCGHSSSDHGLVHAACLRAGIQQGEGDFPSDGYESWIGARQGVDGAWLATYRVDQCDAWLQSSPEVFLILVYGPPSWALVPSSLGEGDPASALDGWRLCNTELLRISALHPGRCLLVNALCAIHDLDGVASHVGEVLGLAATSEIGAAPDASGDRRALDAWVAEAGAYDPGLETLYLELESVAALDAQSRGLMDKERAEVRQTYSVLLQRLGAQSDAATKTMAHLEQSERMHVATIEKLSADNAEVNQAFTVAVSDRDNSMATIAASLRTADDLRQENELLLLEMNRGQQEFEAESVRHAAAVAELRQQLEEVIRHRDEHAGLAETYLGQLSAVRHLPDGDQIDRDLARVLAAKADTDEAYELLLLELHQLQEELERYHGLNRRLTRQLELDQHADHLLRREWRRNQPPDVIFDLRQEISGTNWYVAEGEGRWFGPGTAGTLLVPALMPGLYSVQIDVTDAMATEVLQGLAMSLNGRAVELGAESSAPCFVLGSFFAEESDGPLWIVGLEVPSTISPTQIGGTDARELSIFVRSITFTLLGAA